MAAVDDLDEVLEQYHQALDEIMKGSAEGYKRVYSRRDDVTLAKAITYLTHQIVVYYGHENSCKTAKTLLEAIQYFSDLDVATEFVAKLRWPDGPVCPRCGVVDPKHYYLKTRRLWKCRACKKQFSVKVGTIFEDSPLG